MQVGITMMARNPESDGPSFLLTIKMFRAGLSYFKKELEREPDGLREARYELRKPGFYWFLNSFLTDNYVLDSLKDCSA
jgi:hypothetical protein